MLSIIVTRQSSVPLLKRWAQNALITTPHSKTAIYHPEVHIYNQNKTSEWKSWGDNIWELERERERQLTEIFSSFGNEGRRMMQRWRGCIYKDEESAIKRMHRGREEEYKERRKLFGKREKRERKLFVRCWMLYREPLHGPLAVRIPSHQITCIPS